MKLKKKKVIHGQNKIVGHFSKVKAVGKDLIIEGFANKAVVDRGKDFIEPQAWDLTNFKKNPVILFNHNADMIVGKALSVMPTEQGLRVKVKISNSPHPDVANVRTLVEEGNLRAFSVGFDTHHEQKDADGVNNISKAELFEVSIVGVPMNQDSTFQIVSKSIKSLNSKEIAMLKKEAAAAVKQEGEAPTPTDLLEEALREIAEGGDAKAIMAALHAKWHEMGNPCEEAEENKAEGDDEEEAPAVALVEAPAEEVEAEAAETTEEVAEVVEESTDEAPEEEEKAEGGDDEEIELEEAEDEPEEEKAMMDVEIEAGEANHMHSASVDESGNGRTTGTSEGTEDHIHMIEGGEVMAGENDHGHPSVTVPEAEVEEGEGEVVEMSIKDFQECVMTKVPTLMDEGKGQEEAVAVAIAMCQDQGKCSMSPSRKDYEKFFAVADGYQPKQSVDEDNQSTDTVALEVGTDEQPTPLMAATNQTNVLLGSLIAEIQKLSARLDTSETTEAGLKSSDEKAEDEDNVDSERKYLENLDLRLKKMGY